MKKFLILVMMMGFWGCEIHTHPEPIYGPPTYVPYTGHDYHDYTVYHVYEHDYGYCWGDEEPYWEYPDWCDDYCCTWYVGYGCYEEWCYWDHSCGWEYQVGWCP